jgi:DNA-binding MarR family transcriptional regulator
VTTSSFLAITGTMTEALSRRLKQARFSNPQQKAILSLAVAASTLNDLVDEICKKHGLTRPQHNVLRILRGVHPDGHSRCQIAQRMVERAPDVTRIVDRLTASGLVKRTRGGDDQRQAITHITAKGLKLLQTMQPELESQTYSRLKKLSDSECHELSRLCAVVFGDDPCITDSREPR